MVTNILGSSMNDLFISAAREVQKSGTVSSSRNGSVQYLNNVAFSLDDPTSRHLSLEGRKNNIFAVIAEMFWVMSGSNKISPFLEFYLPRAKDFSDDGETWRGGYGPRLHAHDQLEQAIEMFEKDGLHTRRAIIDIYQSEKDSPLYGETKDVPCNLLANYYVHDGQLCVNQISRSSDLIWGILGVNIPVFTFLQEYVAQRVGLSVGTYTHFTTNLHVYDFTRQQIVDTLSHIEDEGAPANRPTRKSVFPHQPHWFFEDLIEYYIDIIEDRDHGSNLTKIFNDYNVPTNGNQLWDYAKALSSYTKNKAGNRHIELDISDMSEDFKTAILFSPFRKFEVSHKE